MTYKEARVYLDELSKYGSVLGLDTIRGLLRELGNPQDDLRFIHIAGTNGKGSVLAYTSTILSEAGYRVGRYVSPTIVSYRERIQVDGELITQQGFAEETEKVRDAIVRLEAAGEPVPTVFEAETAIAFLYFKKKKCDIVLLEAGLGGAEDATNIITTTECAVFSTISLDHLGVIGNTLEEIAQTKAGIIKPGCLVISAPQKAEVCKVLIDRAEKCGCPIVFADRNQVEIEEENYKGTVFTYKEFQSLSIYLPGTYQIINSMTAIETIQAWRKAKKSCCFDLEQGEEVWHQAVRKGLEKTTWYGRFSCIYENPIFIVDGAHNEDAALRLKESVDAYFPGKKLIMIMGVFRDKEYEKIVRIMSSSMKCVYTVDLPNKERSLPAKELKACIDQIMLEQQQTEEGLPEVYAVGDIEKAVNDARKKAEDQDIILAMGSLSYLGNVLQIVNGWKDKGKEND